jgi:hypothetical protein
MMMLKGECLFRVAGRIMGPCRAMEMNALPGKNSAAEVNFK